MPAGLPEPNPLQPFLLDPDYWRPRLCELEAAPRHLVVLPRPDLSRPGIEVSELRLRAHDGLPLNALLGRPVFGATCPTVQVRPSQGLEADALDWESVEEGLMDLIFLFPDGHEFMDRVLDVVRMSQAIQSLELAANAHLKLRCRPGDGDELTVAQLLQERGWT